MKNFTITLIIGLLLITLIFLADQIANAEGFGTSIEGDSTIVTVTLNNARDSAWVRFAYGGAAFYDSVKASPIAGTNNTNLKSTKLNLDSVGSHYVEILTFTSDAVADTVVGTWYHAAQTPNVNLASVTSGIDISFDSVFYRTFVVQNSSGDAVKFISSGSNGRGLYVVGNATGDAAYFLGGSTSGDGIELVGQGTGVDFNADLNIGDSVVLQIDSTLDLLLGDAGSEAETLIVLASADTTAIQGAVVVVRTLDQSTVKVPGLTTDTNGKLILELGDGVGTDSFYVAISANNYIFNTDTIAVASGGGTDTLWMTQFSPGSPTDTGKVIIYVWTDDVLGDTLERAIFSISPITKSKNWVTDGGRVILPKTESVYTDSLGYGEIEVYRSAYVHPYKYKEGSFETESDSLKYNVTIYKEGYSRFDIYNYIAPSDSSARIGN